MNYFGSFFLTNSLYYYKSLHNDLIYMYKEYFSKNFEIKNTGLINKANRDTLFRNKRRNTSKFAIFLSMLT